MTTLIEFLRARLDDRAERAAKLLRYAQENDVAVRDPDLLGRRVPGWHDWPEVEQMAREVLADIGSKRRIVDWQLMGLDGDARDRGEPTPPGHADQVLRLLALPFAHHPDYDESWKP